jgi:copper/silver efflux system protein
MSEPEPAQHGWVARLIAASAARPFLTILLVAAGALWGFASLRRAPLDAIPDLSDVQVIVFTEWQGQSPDLVEDQLTYPISSALLSAPKVEAVRGQSMFGMSFVNIIFEDGTDIYWARSRVLEYMSSVRAKLPEGVNPTLGPDATGVGWVFQYALVDESGKHDLQELRALQDWRLRYELSRRWRASAASSSSTRSTWIRTSCWATASRSTRWCARCALPIERWAGASSRSPDTSRLFAVAAT